MLTESVSEWRVAWYMQWQCAGYDEHVPLEWDLDLNLELTPTGALGAKTKLHRYLSEGHNDLFRTMHPPRRSTTMTLHDRYFLLLAPRGHTYACA